MSVLSRKLFNRGGKVSSRGVGITSGLVDQPIQKFQSGGSVSRLEALSPALLDLGGRLLGGTSLRGGVGGALEIAGQAFAGSAPSFAEGLQTFRAGQEKDDREIIKDAQGFQRFVDTGERVFPDVEKPLDEPEFKTVKEGETLVRIDPKTQEATTILEKIKPAKAQKNIVLSPNQILIDPDSGQEIARGLSKEDTGFYKLDPGEKLFNAKGEQIAFYEDPNQQVIKLNPGQTAFDQNGNVLFKADPLPTEEKVFKLKPGETAFDANGNVLFSAKPNEQTFKLSPGQTVFDAQGNVLFKADPAPTKEQTFKLSPGQKVFDAQGNEIASVAPSSKESGEKFYKLKPGETLYNDQGDVVFTAPSFDDNLDKYHDFKSKEERFLYKVRKYEEAGIDNLSQVEKDDYFRTLQQIDKGAEIKAESWNEYVSELYKDINFINTMDESIALAKDEFEKARATGPVRGRLVPIFSVFQDVTGVSIPNLVNTMFGKDILLDNIAPAELNRLRNSIAIQFQESMKGQVSDFEARMILNSFFNTLSLPEANEIAFDNMKYINDLRRETIKIAERTNGFTEFEEEMAKWKKENRPDAIKSKDDKYDELRNKYGTILSE